MSGLELFAILLLVLMAVCAIAVVFIRRLLSAVIVYSIFGVLMSIMWLLLEAPDLAITEAAVGAGVTTLLMFVALKKLHAIKTREDEHDGRK